CVRDDTVPTVLRYSGFRLFDSW
nr:immunoglobulin heavy chain junction region [Macaca mulatta]MOX40678.1 immunoglobulin heavy chain junction region [Macaca mulatta]